MLRDKPCPCGIIYLIGQRFVEGFVIGGIWYFCKGVYYFPKGKSFYGGIMMMKSRTLLYAGFFQVSIGTLAMWGGIYSLSECKLIYLRQKDDEINKIASGAITGCAVSWRAGPRRTMKNALIGGIFIGILLLLDKTLIRYSKRKQLKKEIAEADRRNQLQRKKLAKRRRDLFDVDGTPIIRNKK